MVKPWGRVAGTRTKQWGTKFKIKQLYMPEHSSEDDNQVQVVQRQHFCGKGKTM